MRWGTNELIDILASEVVGNAVMNFDYSEKVERYGHSSATSCNFKSSPRTGNGTTNWAPTVIRLRSSSA
jgi:hypothetical protein